MLTLLQIARNHGFVSHQTNNINQVKEGATVHLKVTHVGKYSLQVDICSGYLACSR